MMLEEYNKYSVIGELKLSISLISHLIKTIFFILILFYASHNVFANKENKKIHWKLEALYSWNKYYYGYDRHSDYEYNNLHREEYFVGVHAEFSRKNKKVAPWFSPVLVFSTGWFKGIISRYYNAEGFFGRNLGYGQGIRLIDDKLEFNSIPFIPQTGFIAAPFYKAKRFQNLNLSLRFGYQLNWVQQMYSRTTKEDAVVIDDGQSNSWLLYRSRTTYPTLKQRQFSPLYIHLGISNTIRKSNFGYGISYSWQLGSLRGLELALNYHIR